MFTYILNKLGLCTIKERNQIQDDLSSLLGRSMREAETYRDSARYWQDMAERVTAERDDALRLSRQRGRLLEVLQASMDECDAAVQHALKQTMRGFGSHVKD